MYKTLLLVASIIGIHSANAQAPQELSSVLKTNESFRKRLANYSVVHIGETEKLLHPNGLKRKTSVQLYVGKEGEAFRERSLNNPTPKVASIAVGWNDQYGFVLEGREDNWIVRKIYSDSEILENQIQVRSRLIRSIAEYGNQTLTASYDKSRAEMIDKVVDDGRPAIIVPVATEKTSGTALVDEATGAIRSSLFQGNNFSTTIETKYDWSQDIPIPVSITRVTKSISLGKPIERQTLTIEKFEWGSDMTEAPIHLSDFGLPESVAKDQLHE